MLYLSAFCPQFVQTFTFKKYIPKHKIFKRKLSIFGFSVRWQNLIFPANFNRATPTTVHRTGGAFFWLPFVESVKRQNVKKPFFSGFQLSDTQPPFIGQMVRSFGCCPWEMQGSKKSIFDNFYKNVME